MSHLEGRGATNDRTDRYQQVTDRIVAALEKGVAPWVRPWNAGVGLPHNGKSGHVYKGINTWLCWGADFADSRWFTYKQVTEYGKSHVKKGEKGTPIVKWLFKKVEDGTDATGNVAYKTVPILLAYVVFNYEQVEWDAYHKPKEPEARSDFDPNAACAEAATLLTKAGLELHHGGERACYILKLDQVNLPRPETFDDAGAYWATALHEATHWTGHESRCDRKLTSRFGTEAYAAEELVAELGAAFLCADLGVQGKLQHPQYIANWLKVLGGDKYAIFTAARLAREAVAFLREEGAAVEDEDVGTAEMTEAVAA